MLSEEPFFLRAWTRQLLNEHQAVCYQYSLTLSRPLIELVDVSSYWGKWLPSAKTICISKRLLLDHPWDAVVNVLKHEMAHQLLSEETGSARGHGPDFKKACERLGLAAGYRNAAGPLPSSGRNGDPDRAGGEKGRKIEKIRKLLALADSANEHEALLAMGKARQMMERYDLTENLESGKEESPCVNLLINLGKKRLQSYHRAICALLIDHFRVEIVITPLFDARELTSYKCLDIMGRSDNVRIAGYVYHFLMDRLPLMWRGQKTGGRAPKYSRNSYWLGVLNGFREGLATEGKEGGPMAGKTATAAVQARKLPAVTDDLAIRSYVQARYPKLKRGRNRGARVDPDSYEQGCRAGRRLKLRKGLESNPPEERMLPGPPSVDW
ncbi:MAG: SprT-like domain-containing protein [Desulfurivibrionaceae bacterium]